MIYLGIIIVVIFYLLPWLVIHSWVLISVVKGNDTNDETFAAVMAGLVVLGVIPFINLATVWYMFILKEQGN